ncbi:MAG: response regulator [Cyanobacteria bacterium P01_C01_bin.118]
MTKKILLVEHDEPTCQLLQDQLTQHGYNIVLAPDGGDEGILMAVTESPDLILVATDLPVINGWQAIKILKSSTVTQAIPIIAMMALTNNDQWSNVSESGCDDYELKPINLDNILDKIKALLNPAIGSVPSYLSPFQFQEVSKSQSPLKVQTSQNFSAEGADTWIDGESMVVYVDDSPADSQAMAEIVRRAGYGYDNVSEPLEAIPLLLELRPNLIFLDLVMPFTNGYELCAQIRRTSTFRKTPIIIVTNNDGIIDRVRARFVGASGFFSKPVKEERVLKVLKKYLKPIQHQPSQNIPQDKLFV